MVFLVGIGAALVVMGIWWIASARRSERRRERLGAHQPPPLLYPVARAAQGAQPIPAWTPAIRASAPTPPPATPAPVPRAARVPDVEVAIVPDEEPDAGSTIHFRRPDEQALQLLPGRLEVLAGERRHKEIRLMRVPGERAEVVLGRERVDAPGHVALQSSTVSRRHARLAYADGVWRVANLSETNPVMVNDETLAADHERPLADGDRLELGEVVLRFHAR